MNFVWAIVLFAFQLAYGFHLQEVPDLNHLAILICMVGVLILVSIKR